MPLIPEVSNETTIKLSKLSDEIGRLTKRILEEIENGDPGTPNGEDEKLLEELKKEFGKLAALAHHAGPQRSEEGSAVPNQPTP